MMQILFEPRYNIGDVVSLRIAPENKMVIDSYQIMKVNSAGEVTHYRYSLYDVDGNTFYFSDLDLHLVESIKQE